MTDPDLIRLFIEPLERFGLSYMVTGGVASVVYGDPRFTRDVDVVLALDATGVADLEESFAGDDFYVPPEETLLEEAARKRGGHFNVVHRDTALRADIYLAGDDPFHDWALGRRRRIEVDDLSIWVAPIEYVILRKLEYFRSSGSDRHLRDVAMMLRISGDLVDSDVLKTWSARMELEDVLEKAREYDPS